METSFGLNVFAQHEKESGQTVVLVKIRSGPRNLYLQVPNQDGSSISRTILNGTLTQESM